MNSFTPFDVRAFLERLHSAIEADQARIDALSPSSLPQTYDDCMWRGWRKDHGTIIQRLLASVDQMSITTHQMLTMIALSKSYKVVQPVLLEFFAEAVTEMSVREESAEAFFSAVVRQLATPPGLVRFTVEQALENWIPYADPLGISRDSECGYALVTH